MLSNDSSMTSSTYVFLALAIILYYYLFSHIPGCFLTKRNLRASVFRNWGLNFKKRVRISEILFYFLTTRAPLS